jgi:hypothetical protein
MSSDRSAPVASHPPTRPVEGTLAGMKFEADQRQRERIERLFADERIRERLPKSAVRQTPRLSLAATARIALDLGLDALEAEIAAHSEKGAA